MALASTLCALVEHMSVAKQTSSIPLHGRLRRGREYVHLVVKLLVGGKPTHLSAPCQIDQPLSKQSLKKKRKSNNKLNKSLEQGLNLSGS